MITSERVHGPDHPWTAHTLANRADLLMMQVRAKSMLPLTVLRGFLKLVHSISA